MGALVSLLRQPPLIGYLLAGLLIGLFGIVNANGATFETMSQIGVTLLLFLVGMELSFEDLKAVGKPAVIVGIGEILITFVVTCILSFLFGFDWIMAVYIGAALSFSSTIIVVKLLSQKNDLASLHGKMSLGILLFEDVVAITILMLMSSFGAGTTSSILIPFILWLVKGSLIFTTTLFLSRFFFPRFMKIVALSPEMVFVTSIAWCLGLASLVSLPFIGFSSEIGGFLAGLALANSSEHYQIISRIRPVRDFFVTIFFIALGTSMLLSDIFSVLLPALVLSLFILVGKPIIVLSLMGLSGFRKRTAFLTGITIAQISEFGLILIVLGIKVGHVSQTAVSLVTLVGVITMTASTYLIIYGNKIYRFLSPHLALFEKKNMQAYGETQHRSWNDHIILVGYNRVGRMLLAVLKELNHPIVVVDFDPSVITQLTADGIEALYGDISDHEFLALLHLDKAKLVVSTVLDVQDNMTLLEAIRSGERFPLTIITASYPTDAIELYEAKADFVLIPYHVGGEHIAHLIEEHGIDHERFHKLGSRHFDHLVNELGRRRTNETSFFYHFLPR